MPRTTCLHGRPTTIRKHMCMVRFASIELIQQIYTHSGGEAACPMGSASRAHLNHTLFNRPILGRASHRQSHHSRLPGDVSTERRHSQGPTGTTPHPATSRSCHSRMHAGAMSTHPAPAIHSLPSPDHPCVTRNLCLQPCAHRLAWLAAHVQTVQLPHTNIHAW